jgi:hypothetical protein
MKPRLLFPLLLVKGQMAQAPPPGSEIISALVFVVILFAIGYGIYSKILKQMAINAKNKRIIKNQVTYWTGREYRRSKRS